MTRLRSRTSALARLKARATTHPVLLDVVLAACLYLLLAFGLTSEAEVQHAHGSQIGALLNVALVGPLAWRRRAPLAVLGATTGGAVTVAIAFGLIGGEAAVLVALATVAERESPARVAAAALVVVVAVIAIAAALSHHVAERLTAGLAAVVAAVAVGIAARARRAQLAALADRTAQLERERAHEADLAVAAERARIARELHDVVAHNVSVMVALADGAQHVFDDRPDQVRGAIGQIAATGREALTELRELLGLLRDGDDRAAVRAPQPGTDQLDELIERVRAAGLEARLRVEGEPRELSPLTQVTVYRIVQEALTNVLRHAVAASSVDVRLRWLDDEVAIEVLDDGRRRDAPAATRAGRGVAGMRERAAVHGAPLSAGPAPGGGWRVATRLSYRPAPASR